MLLYTVTANGTDYPDLTEATVNVMRRVFPGCHVRPQVDCAPVVVTDLTARYPYKAECPCGWASRGYARDHAAQTMADDHRSK